MFKPSSFGTAVKILFYLTVIVFCILLTPSPTQAAYRDTIQAEGTLLYYWPMDEPTDATSSTALVGGVNLNFTNVTASSSGQIDGAAIYFNGSSSFGSTSSSLDFTAYDKVVVEALIYFNAYTNSDKAAWELSPTINGCQTGFIYATDALNHNNNSVTIVNGNIGYNYKYYNRPEESNWHHVVTIFDKGATSTAEVNIYVDGAPSTVASVGSASDNSNNFGNHVFYIMSRAGTSLFNSGKLQHLAIYSDLNDAQILAHAEASGVISTPAAGSLSEATYTTNTITVSWTAATGGIEPVTTQLQRRETGEDSWSNVSGATTSPYANTDITPGTSYDYRILYTDAILNTTYSNTISATAGTLYTIQQEDLWDNVYDNTSTPRQSSFSRFLFTTDAPNITVIGETDIYTLYPTFAQIGARVDGVYQSPMEFSANGSANFNLTLGEAGISRTVEIISGLQTKPSSLTGSFINSIIYPEEYSFTISPPTVGDRITFYGDSITGGGNATNPENETYAVVLRNTYSHRTMVEAWGYRSLYSDANTAGLRASFVNQLATATPSIIWLAIGTNDYGLNFWTAANFGTAYAAVLDDLHTASPATRIVCQTPIVRSSEVANGSGNTLDDYRGQITAACAARSWTTLMDGTTILTTGDLQEGVHPTTAGHAKYALAIDNFLTLKPTLTTSAASSIADTTAIFNGSIAATGSTTPTGRGFNYGLTTEYEIASTTESDSFDTGDFDTTITNLTPNTTYHFRSYATNFAGTDYGSDENFTTLAPTPANFTASAGRDNVVLIVDSFTNDTNSSSGYYFSRSGANSGWLQTNSWTDTELSCGTSYSYSVKYRNSDGTETDAVTVSATTEACGGGLPPGAANPPVAPTNNWQISLVSAPDDLTGRIVNLKSNAGPDVKRMAVSLDKNFIGAVQETYSPEKQVDLCPQFDAGAACPNGTYTIYVKFYTQYGVPTEIVTRQATIANALPSMPTIPPSITTPVPTIASFMMTKNFKLGDQDKQIKLLQQFLNNHGFKLANSGFGSPGRETEYFGTLTQAALIKFQIINQLLAEKGYLGALTCEAMNSYQTPAAAAPPPSISAVFKNNLFYGLKSDEVKRLQQLLATRKDLYPEGLTTGYYGRLTEKAVMAFQLKYGVVASAADSGAGNCGHLTRAQLLKVFGGYSRK